MSSGTFAVIDITTVLSGGYREVMSLVFPVPGRPAKMIGMGLPKTLGS
jgi:hypothetical protein